jgi:Protein of unknown function (DUF2974)
MVNYRQLFNEDYTDIVKKVTNIDERINMKDKIKQNINNLLNYHIKVSEYELWMFSRLAYSNDGIYQKFIDKFYDERYQIVDFINEPDGLQFYVIKSRMTKDLIIAFRGTDEWVDWLTNIQIISKKSKQFDTAKMKLEKILSLYNDYYIYFCGHSLGGALAQEMHLFYYSHTKLNIIRTVTFNSAGIRSKNDNNYSNLPIYNYVIDKDVVGSSTGYHYGKVIYVKPKEVTSRLSPLRLYTHALEQFIFDRRGNVFNRIDDTRRDDHNQGVI